MKPLRNTVTALLALALFAPAMAAQSFPTDDPVIRQIWQLGMEESRAYPLAQALLDSVGPRLTGTPGQNAAHDWAVKTYQGWGIEAEKEQYGTWTGWRRGVTHVDLLAPRVRSLEAQLLGWSGSNGGVPVEGEVVIVPALASAQEADAWVGTVAGKFVLVDFPQPTCRPDDQWREYAAPGSFQRMGEERDAARLAFNRSRAFVGQGMSGVETRLEEAGAAGVFRSNWSNAPGTNKVFSAATRTIPSIDVGCEDYGLMARLAENGQGPRVRVTADSEFLDDAPTFNTIARIPGTELPDEYIVLSAHYDSWDGGSGATDNGTGSITMIEAMRILKAAYPNPRRTIIAGLWSGEEQGLNGSRAWAADNPEVVDGLQALFNQDNGTGRVVSISMQGLVDAGSHFADWLAQIPGELTSGIDLNIPGTPGSGGSDYASFICAGAPAFSLSSLSWGYSTYTWHTNRDTFDKIVFDDLKNNATLTAMLTYLASEDPERVSRAQRVLPAGRGGQPGSWPQCRDGQRTPPGGG